MRIAIIVSCVVAFASSVRAGEIRDFPFDPVAYVNGQESAGTDDFKVERGAYRYKFVDATSKAMFEKDPERYEVQLGGACARMGPLNPPQAPAHHALHNGKIYVFASESCRATFLTNPEAMLEADDPPPDVSDDSIKRGRDLLDRVVNAMGGAEKLDAIKTYDDKMYMVAGNDNSYNGLWIRFPDSFSQKFKRQERWTSMTNAGRVAWFDSNDQADRMAESQRHAFTREVSRLLLFVVKSRNEATFICSYVGTGEFNEKQVEQIAVALNGTTQRLMIDPTSGHIIGQTYRARGPQGFLGDYELVYSDHQTFDGVTLPITWSTKFNGEYIAEFSGTLDEVHVNAPMDDAMFDMPKDK